MKKILILILLISIVSCENDSIRKTNYDNGNVKEEYEVNSEGEKHGKYTLYYKNGQIKESRIYQNGLVYGKTIDYYPNGIIELITTCTNGMYDGEVKLYGKKGNLEMIQLYKCDTLLIDKRYYSNGKFRQLESKIVFKEETQSNTIVEFDESGKQTDVSRYVEWKIVNDNLIVNLTKGFIKDSIKIEIVKDFQSKEKIREIEFTRNDQLKIKLQPSYYHKNRLNINVRDFQPETNIFIDSSGIAHYIPWSDYYIQIDKGEKPKKYNLDPIW